MSIQREDDPALYDHLRSGAGRTRDLDPRDLELITTTLELAVLELAPAVGAEFTHAELFARAREIDPDMHDRDYQIVLPQLGYLLRRLPGGRYAMK